MNCLALVILVSALSLLSAAPAEARVGISFGFGGCCGYYPYYSPYYYGYPAYYAPTYYAPPPPTTVIYSQPAPVTYVQPPAPSYVQQAPASYVQQAPAPVAASQASPTFTDAQGRTCRKFQSTINGALVNGTACSLSDGTWRTVEDQP